MAKDWIFIGDHNLRGEAQVQHRLGGEAPKGELIEPFVPFDCSAQWRASYRRSPRIDRQIMTIDDYARRLETYTLAQLFNEARRRVITNAPVPVQDAANILRPSSVYEKIRNAVIANERSVVAKRYGLDAVAIANSTPELARIEIIRGATRYICDRAKKTESEIRSQLVENLIAPIRKLQEQARGGSEEPSEPSEVETQPEVLTVEERREKVSQLLQDGWTQKAMGQVLGVSRSTIQLDIASVKEQQAQGAQHGG